MIWEGRTPRGRHRARLPVRRASSEPLEMVPPPTPIAPHIPSFLTERTVSLMADQTVQPPVFDTRTPTPARIYDYYLGGKDNYAADREAGEKVIEAFPEARRLARENRGFLLRTVRHCAEAGIGQFIDLGTGIPTAPSVADIACAFNPRSRVVGIDNDPVVLNHQRAHAPSSPGGYTIIEGDIRKPWAILADPKLGAVIDLSRPVAVLCAAVLHFIPDLYDPAGIIGAFTDTMATGSFLSVSAVTSTDTDPSVIAQIEGAYTDASAPVIFRPAEAIRSWFDRLEMVPPGLVQVCHWPTDSGLGTDVRILGGLAWKR